MFNLIASDIEELLSQTFYRCDTNTYYLTGVIKSLGTGKEGRTFTGSGNLLAKQEFYVDIDTGKGKHYESVDEARDAFTRACACLGLPFPIVILTGHGIHGHWPLAAPIFDMAKWQMLMDGLFAALERAGLRADPACNDAARILRLPGTANFKGDSPIPVTIHAWGDGPVPLSAFDKFNGLVPSTRKQCGKGTRNALWPKLGKLPAYLDHHPVRTKEQIRGYFAALGWRPLAHLEPIIETCRQLYEFAKCRGNTREPTWYAVLGLLAFVKDGERLAHELSKGHPKYSPEETQAKFEQAKSNLSAPSTCARFQKLGNGLCNGCRHVDKLLTKPSIHSPFDLGVE
jgi:hypothetical protein